VLGTFPGLSLRLIGETTSMPRVGPPDSQRTRRPYGTGTTGGAPLLFTKNTRNFAGWESLAFLETVCTSSGDS
jgi:hypothetical protein